MNCTERSHLPRPGKPHVQPFPRRERVLCDPCREKLNLLGMDFRLVVEPVWLARQSAKDYTGALR